MLFCAQWALLYESGHPFLKKTLEMVINNLRTNRDPNDGHKMTGPKEFTKAIKECKDESENYNYREAGVEYAQKFKIHYGCSKFYLYGLFRIDHWSKKQATISVLKNSN